MSGAEALIVDNVATYHGSLRAHATTGAMGTSEIWRCEHDHRTMSPANQCAKAEKDRRVSEETQRDRIRLPGIHADILLERHTDGLDADKVRLTVIEDDQHISSFGDYGSAEISLTPDGIRQLIDALEEINRAG